MKQILALAIFLLVFLSIYGGMHVYVFWKANAAMHFSPRSSAAVIAFMALMVLSVVLGHLLERAGAAAAGRVFLYAGYVWGGLLFLFFSGSLLVDAYRLLVYVAGLVSRRDLAAAMPSARVSFLLPLLVSLAANVYGYFEASSIRVEHLIITTPRMPAEAGRLRVVQISDVHLGVMIGGERAGKIFEVVKKTDPDILVSTGDLVDQSSCDVECWAEPILEVKARYGKYAVTGNHEYYAGLEQALRFTRQAGFTVLRGEGVTVAGLINLAGVDDHADGRFDEPRQVTEKQILAGLPGGKYTILLKHRPTVDPSSVGLFDLQLSGHTHKGQIFPFSLITRMVFIIDAGWLDLSGRSHLYVSRGTGFWGPPIRVLAPPEVTVIDLVHGDTEGVTMQRF